MTDPELLEIEQACEKARKGPFEQSCTLDGVVVIAEAAEPYYNVAWEVEDAAEHWTVDQRRDLFKLFAAAPVWLPLLCREVRELRKEREALREALELAIERMSCYSSTRVWADEARGKLTAAESSHRLLVERQEKK